MDIIENALDETLCDQIYNFAIDTVNGKNIRKKELHTAVWTNYSWPQHVFADSPLILCMTLPKELQNKLELELIRLNIYDPKTDHSFDEYSACMIHIWPYGSYIGRHSDGPKKTFTAYLNRDWNEEYGGIFKWYKEGLEWETIVPKFNTMILNDGGIPHYTTPVETKKHLRVSIQGFIFNKNNLPLEMSTK